jgi:hypothetical protein
LHLSVQSPAEYIVFDILEKDGKPVTDLSLSERKELLRNSLREGKHVSLSDLLRKKAKTTIGRQWRRILRESLPNEKVTLFDCYAKIDYLTESNSWKTASKNIGINKQGYEYDRK